MNSVTNHEKEKVVFPKVFAVKHKDITIRMDSRSGGIFTALSDYVLSIHGVVYGCVLDDRFLAVHVRTEDYDTRNRMRGSKYIQSEMRDAFLSVKKDIQDGRLVLFSGTSCQIAGLKSYLGGINTENLLCVDIVCHGVPSPKVWKAFLAWQEKKYGGKTQAVVFRNKRDYGWKAHIESIYLDNVPRIDSEIFKTLFYCHNILRPCCYCCPYKDIHHPGDITIADYWGIEKAAPGFSDNRGVSLVLINNLIGGNYFELIKNDLVFRETKIDDSMQPPLVAPFPKPSSRDDFWKDFLSKDFDYIARKYGGYGIGNAFKRVFRKLFKKLFRR